ncbi:AHH domain-containing protein [Corallococcus sp. BB11-1]|uniref:AHH domain-containing protein n=1 Tax=Corallococcus sp. BB11-1 TaxID=2996783 RepID=UPI0010DBE573|nr:AHH domain-containing protein [Corallococcus sp. BB11-1]MCY1031893.1 AHH domain-containing protein [Corallococcus sp. BB11-1]RYZ18010.1 MAG: hypothetical protein EOO70_00185 [Myxococcaceae bacterium]
MAFTAAKDHILSTYPMQAVLCRSKEYRKNGINCIRGDPGKLARVYNNNSKIKKYLIENAIGTRTPGATAGDDSHAAGYHFNHFTEKAGTPYPNAGHHILPCELFTVKSEGSKQGGVFEEEEFKILRRVKYDINNGENLIFLPAINNSHCGVHQLPCHVGSHPGYTAEVSFDVEQINLLLKESLNEPCEDWKPPESIPAEIKKYEKKYWNWIVTFGENTRGSHINTFRKELVAELTKKTKSRPRLGKTT